ncbi:hypothetical protein DQG23_30305 [Paenibacillus contaminans]|uniref:Uncharacterized protein n=1 Tax=Paenibacillus contaminans TaxID=450362 RepID=A0A329M6A8_9BACL|nr:hypothetical protein DQG23_30305 [Paenibacillus contaminans]
MSRNRARNERMLRMVVFFLGIVFITIAAFYVLSMVMDPAGDQGLLVVICMVISLQISFLTAYVIMNSKKT